MPKKRVVYVQGTWDLFHIGHLNILRKARRIATKLIVGVNTDKSVQEYKGDYPVIPYQERVEILKACSLVDEVVMSKMIFNIDNLKKLNVDVIVLGSDWKNRYLEGKEEAQKAGIEIIYFPYTEGISTTEIKAKIRRRYFRI